MAIDKDALETGKISVWGARVHNLKNIDVEIPRNTLTVITGMSGSGKSSLAFDTLFAEGQRRYVETFSAYARNFLGNMERPDVDKVTGLSQNFWLRALGWFSMALLDTLGKTDASAAGESYEKLKQIFVELMDAMLKYQDESGMWYQVVNFGGMDKNYLETSGSSIMAYALLKGVRLGFLPESYRAYGEKAFHGICDNYLSTDENGNLHLGGICLVAGLGGANRRPGTYDYYMSEPVVKDDAKGVGPFLLAYTEMLRLKK